MDISQWLQVIGVVRAVEDTGPCRVQDYENSTTTRAPKGQHAPAALNCPRCKSSNTKFCYYNNYSISQPRYLCKACKRYWTEGGHLRNVPVGGGSRKTKNKPSSSSSSSSSSSKKAVSNLSQPKISSDQNHTTHDGRTIYFDFNNPESVCNGMSEFEDMPFGINFENNLNPHSPNLCSSTFSHDIPDNSMISMPVYESNSVFSSSSFDNHMDYDIKPSLSYSMDGLEHCYGNNMPAVQENATSPRIIFPFEELKPMSPSDYQFDTDFSQGDSNGCWNGMMYDGSW